MGVEKGRKGRGKGSGSQIKDGGGWQGKNEERKEGRDAMEGGMRVKKGRKGRGKRERCVACRETWEKAAWERRGAAWP